VAEAPHFRRPQAGCEQACAAFRLVTVKEFAGHSPVPVRMRSAQTNRDAKRRAVALIAVNGAEMATGPVLKSAAGQPVTLPASDWEIR